METGWSGGDLRQVPGKMITEQSRNSQLISAARSVVWQTNGLKRQSFMRINNPIMCVVAFCSGLRKQGTRRHEIWILRAEAAYVSSSSRDSLLAITMQRCTEVIIGLK